MLFSYFCASKEYNYEEIILVCLTCLFAIACLAQESSSTPASDTLSTHSLNKKNSIKKISKT